MLNILDIMVQYVYRKKVILKKVFDIEIILVFKLFQCLKLW